MKSLDINFHTVRQQTRNVGFAVLIVGMQIGMFLNLFVANIGWNNILPPLALLAIVNVNNISKLRFPLLSRSLVAVIFFQILVLLYICYQGYDGPDVTLFTLFVTATLLCFASLNVRQLDYAGIIKAGWWLSFVCCLLGLYVTTLGRAYVKLATAGNDLMVDGLTLGGGGVICILFSLFYKPKTRIVKTLVMLGIFIGIATIVFSGKRSPLLVGAAMCLLYCYKIKGLNFVQTVKIGILLLIGGGILISVFNTEFNIVEQLNNSIERTVTGIDDMLTGSSKSGQSARMRYFAKQWAYDYIDIRFTAINFILGAGVMTRWLDVPILQSFLDMGIIGFMFFVVFVIAYPIRILLSRLSNNPQILFACLYCLPNIVTTFNSGTPYGMARWIPIGFLLVVLVAFRKTQRANIMQKNCQTDFTSDYSTINRVNV